MGKEADAGIYWRPDINAWWPRYDHKPERCFQFVAEGLGAIPVAQRYLRKTRQCVQAGGHAGFWPRRLANIFGQVFTFEPEQALFECLRRNTEGEARVHAYPQALGACHGAAMLKSHVSAGSWRIDPEGEHAVEVRTIDGLNLEACDAIFLDVEGYEVEALKGAARTIEACRPLILVELLPRSKDAIDAHLVSINYRQAARFGRDGIYVPQ